MKKYKIKIEPEALADIRDITNWYKEISANLGKRFHSTTIKQINSLNNDPHIFAIRYNEIRCMLVEKFPYMVHFFINEKTMIVEIFALISTSQNPKIWEEKTRNNI